MANTRTYSIRNMGRVDFLVLASIFIVFGFTGSAESTPPEPDAPPPLRTFKDWNAEPFFGDQLRHSTLEVKAVKPMDEVYDIVFAQSYRQTPGRLYEGLFILKRGETAPFLVLYRSEYPDAYARLRTLEATENRLFATFYFDCSDTLSGTSEYLYDLKDPKLIAAFPSGTDVRGMALSGRECWILIDDSVTKRVLRVQDTPNNFLEVAHTFENVPPKWSLTMRQGLHGPEISTGKTTYCLRDGSWVVAEAPAQSPENEAARNRLKELHSEIGTVYDLENVPVFRSSGMGKDFLLLNGTTYGVGVCSEPHGFAVIDHANITFIPLPQPNENTYYRLRPTNLIDPDCGIGNGIGPHVLSQDRLLFGITFYDSEGLTGLGGWGAFDFTTSTYELHYPPEMAGWSASALLAEGDTLWFGLVDNEECSFGAGGVLRLGMTDNSVHHYPLPEKVTGLARCGEAIIATGTHSVFRLADCKVTRAEFRHRPDGSLEIVTGPLQVLSPAY